jgi:hypothetical protein
MKGEICMVEVAGKEIESTEVTQEFNNKLMAERLPLPTRGMNYKVPLYSRLHLLKNFELEEELGIGNHKLDLWQKVVAEAEGKEDFYSMFRIDMKPTSVNTKRSKKILTYYEKEYGVNFKFRVIYNYSFRIHEASLFLENVCQYIDKYSSLELYSYIEDEINDIFLSFIAKSLLDKKISVLDYNSNILEFSNNFTTYCNTTVFEATGIQIMDFNYVSLSFEEDETFLNIKDVLYDKADMKLRKYTWKERAKYIIMANQDSSNDFKEEDEQ